MHLSVKFPDVKYITDDISEICCNVLSPMVTQLHPVKNRVLTHYLFVITYSHHICVLCSFLLILGLTVIWPKSVLIKPQPDWSRGTVLGLVIPAG